MKRKRASGVRLSVFLPIGLWTVFSLGCAYPDYVYTDDNKAETGAGVGATGGTSGAEGSTGGMGGSGGGSEGGTGGTSGKGGAGGSGGAGATGG
ncbi:MAG TPA: hypothetical protein PLM08_09780, partial [Polyangiaceae bacterium]|nr:hypothetical protein [Polyangiaceae bacterium]